MTASCRAWRGSTQSVSVGNPLTGNLVGPLIDGLAYDATMGSFAFLARRPTSR